jgi:signal transduction histidine kinase
VTAPAVLGRVLWEAVPALGGPYEAASRRARAEGRPVTVEAHVEAHAVPVDARHEVRAVPSPDGPLTLYARDVTARHAAEGERERLLDAAEAARADAERARADAERARADAERARAEAEAARGEAERANAAKSRFLATVSHELRTPLNAIAGHVQLIEMEIHGPVTDAQRQALARVDRAQRHLLRLIDEVLDFAKLESGRFEYEVERVALPDALRDAVQMVEPQAAAKGLAVALRLTEAPTEAPIEVWADRARLEQVLLNLLSNAVKFTEAGGVSVAVSGDAHDPRRVRVEVIDTGVGIPPDQLEHVFQPFVQVHDARGHRAEGTGLGLPISRELARGMGGDLTAASAPDGGAAFTLALRRVVSASGEPVDRRSRDERREGADRRATGERRVRDLP